jgi:hypothetical protein
MSPLDLPPKLWLPAAPAIVRPAPAGVALVQKARREHKAWLPGWLPPGAAFVAGVQQAFPVVAGTQTSVDAPGNTTNPVALPTGITAGELLIVLVGSTLCLPSTPSGWTQLFNVGSVSDNGLLCFFKVATGSEGASVNVTLGSNGGGCANVAYRITGYQGSPEAATVLLGGTTPDPPNLAPSWGSAKTLWIAACGNANTASDLTAPANYANLVQPREASKLVQCGSARRELEAASENPGAFANASNSTWTAAIIAIRPA